MVRKQVGFTVIELMISIAVFSTVMLLVTMGAIQVGQNYQQAAIQVQLSNAARELHEQIAQEIQFSGPTAVQTGTAGAYSALCLGTTRYAWQVNDMLYRDKIASPGDCFVASVTTTAVLPTNGKVVALNVVNTGSNGVFVVQTRFVVGADDMFVNDDPAQACKSKILGREFCAVSDLITSVTRKVVML